MEEKRFNPSEYLIDLKGKEYLPVQWRLVWLRQEHPDWSIDTQLVSHEDNGAVFCAKIRDAEGRLVSSGHGSEVMKDFHDYLEKAETKAVGRALAMCGYGTQFTADELDEGDRVVDAPVAPLQTFCADCGAPILDTTSENGKIITAERLINRSRARFGRCLCETCGIRAAATGQ